MLRIAIGLIIAVGTALLGRYVYRWRQLFTPYEPGLTMELPLITGEGEKFLEAQQIRNEVFGKCDAGLKQMGTYESSFKREEIEDFFTQYTAMEWWLQHEAELLAMDDRQLVEALYQWAIERPSR